MERDEITIETLFAKAHDEKVKEAEANKSYGYFDEVVYAIQQTEEEATIVEVRKHKCSENRGAKAHQHPQDTVANHFGSLGLENFMEDATSSNKASSSAELLTTRLVANWTRQLRLH